MTDKPLSWDDEGLQYAWDATSISTAQTCLRKYEFQRLGWRKKGLNANLRFGQHYATALEHYYKHVHSGMDPEDAIDEVVLEALKDTWDTQIVDADMAEILQMEQGTEYSGPWESGDNLKNRENLIRTIVWYVDHFKDDPAPVITLSDGKPAVEYSFSLEVDNGIVFAGHIDRLVTYADNPYVMDQKTTRNTIGPFYWKGFKPNTQMSMYTFAGQAIYGSPVKGVIIDAVQIAVGFSRFERGFTFRTPSELDEWYDNTMYWIETARTATQNQEFHMNPESCTKYGGCPFQSVCEKSPDVRLNFLKADFEQSAPWDPLKVR